jgi:hypothetical protein
MFDGAIDSLTIGRGFQGFRLGFSFRAACRIYDKPLVLLWARISASGEGGSAMRHGTTLRLVLALAILPILMVGKLSGSPPQIKVGPPLPETRLGVRTAPILLLSRPDVRADLGLSPELSVAADRELSALYVRAAQVKGKTGPDAVQARRAIDDAHQRWLTANLSFAQRERLLQIDLQWEGPPALISRSMVASIVKLNDAQRQALAEAIARREAERATGKVRPEDEIPLGKQTLAILLPEQRERWLGLLGRPCAFQIGNNTKPVTSAVYPVSVVAPSGTVTR